MTAAPASDWLCGLYRQVSAGVLASLAFQALAAAVFTTADPGLRVGVVSQSAEFLRPVVPDGRELVVDARVTYQQGERVLARVEVTDADGDLVVAGHQDSLLLEPRQRQSEEPQRLLLSVVFTDLVGSTQKATELGDERWRELLAEHHRAARRQLEIHKGREVKTTGDGFLATFDSPARAARCARAIREAVRALGLEVRAGVHTGECEVVAGDVAGIAVHVAARITSSAAPGEILVSATVRDLTAGSGLSFTDRGRRALKGLEGSTSSQSRVVRRGALARRDGRAMARPRTRIRGPRRDP